MDQNKNELDKYFREGLADFEATPPAEVWVHIQENMPRKKRKRFIVWWMLSLVAAGGIGFFANALLHRQNTKSNHIPIAYNTAQSNINKTASDKISSESNYTETSTKKTFANQQNIIRNLVDNNKIERYQTQYISLLTQSDNLASIDKQQDEVLSQNYMRNESIASTETNALTTNTTATVTPKLVDINQIPTTQNDILASLPIIQHQVIVSSDNIVAIQPNPIIAASDNEAKNIIVPIKAKSKWTHGIELNGGMVYNQSKFSSKTIEKTSYATLRDTSEKFKIGYDFGMQYNAVHLSGIGLRTGVKVTQWVDHLHNVNKLYSRRTQKVAQYRDKQGSVAYADTVNQFLRGQLIQDFYNKYTTIDIPIQVGFEYAKSPSLEYFLYGGALVNVLFAADGNILAQNKNIISYPKEKVYKTRTAIGLTANIGMRRKIAKHWWLLGGLQSNMDLKSILVKENILKQKNIKTGIQVGFKYQF